MDQALAAASDGVLLEALERRPEALTVLVTRHQAVLLRHARAIVGDRGPFEDAVQETFLRLLERPPRMPPEARGNPEAESAQIRSWLHKVLRNCCMDTLRAETRRRSREEEAAASEVARDAHALGAALVEERDTRAAVERGLHRLPADQREVLVLRLLGERSYKEIAEITGKKIGTVGWLVSEGLRALAQHLAPLVEAQPQMARVPAPARAGETRP